MVRKETCPRCKGNRFVHLPAAPAPNNGAAAKYTKCPECGGQGYKIRIVR